MAMLSGILRPRRNRPPAAATSDRFTSGMPKVAVVEATTRSHDSTISVPPASAGPSTAAMIGLVRSRWTMPAKPPRWVASPPALPALISLRSAPAQNTGGSPVRIPTQMRVVGLDLVDGLLDALGDGAVHRVAGLRAVDLDDRERSTLLEVDGHGRHPTRRATRRIPSAKRLLHRRNDRKQRSLSCDGRTNRCTGRAPASHRRRHSMSAGQGTCNAPSVRHYEVERLYLASLHLDSCACQSCGARWDEDATTGDYRGRGDIDSIIAPRPH